MRLFNQHNRRANPGRRGDNSTEPEEDTADATTNGRPQWD